MATFDQLSADKRAVIELVLQQGRSYEELSTLLGMPEARVRTLARDALVELAPVSAMRVEEDWRGQLADYVLGQQGGPEATATKGHLRRSEAARTWARSLLDSLDQLYRNGSMPVVPEGERGARARAGASRSSAAAPADLSPEARAVVRRRRIAGAAAAGALVLIALLLWPIGLLGGDDEGGGESGPAATAAASGSRSPAGVAVVLGQRDQRVLRVDATGLTPSTRTFAYQVWLYDSPQRARSLGLQVTDRNGTFQGTATLPAGFQRFRFIDLSREPLDDRDEGHSGESVLRGKMPRLERARGNRAAVLGQVVLEPLPSG